MCSTPCGTRSTPQRTNWTSCGHSRSGSWSPANSIRLNNSRMECNGSSRAAPLRPGLNRNGAGSLRIPNAPAGNSSRSNFDTTDLTRTKRACLGKVAFIFPPTWSTGREPSGPRSPGTLSWTGRPGVRRGFRSNESMPATWLCRRGRANRPSGRS